MTDITELRLALQANGYGPVPVRGKATYLQGWQTKTSVSTDEVGEWARLHPDWNNTGILTGPTPAFDLDIQDPDAAAACEERLRKWFDNYGTLITRFGNPPKRALLFQTPEPFKKIRADFVAPNGSAHHIEVLGDGQQIVVEGTHPTGRPYSWHGGRGPLTVKREDLPKINEATATRAVELLGELLVEEFGFKRVQPGGQDTSRTNGGGGSSDTNEGPVDVAADLEAIRPGNVNDTQCRVIGSLLSQGVDYSEIIERVVDATMAMAANHYRCRGWTREREYGFVYKCLGGILKTRCREHQNIGMAPAWVPPHLAELFEAMCNAGQRPSIVWRTGSGWHLRDMAYAWGAGETTEQHQPEPDPVEGTEPASILGPDADTTWPTPYSARAASDIPPRQWLYGKHYMRGAVTLTAAPGGTGKSQHSLFEAVSMATGRDLLTGERLPERLRVWVWNAEDDINEMERRVCGICDHYAINREELRGGLFLDSSDTLPLDLAHGNGRGTVVRENIIQTIASRVRECQIDVSIFDPLVALHTLPEGDNPSLAKILRALRQRIAVPCSCAVELIHHTRKASRDADRDMTADDIRGAGSIVYSARSGRLLHPMSTTDAEQFGIEGDDRFRYFRVERAKTNMARRETICWVEMVERPIANGANGSYRDSVVVSTLWIPPELTDKLSPTIIAAIRDEIGRGEYKRDARAREAWAGRLIGQRLNLDMENKAYRRQAKDLLDWLIRNKHLASEFRKDTNRKVHEYVVPGNSA